MQWNIQKALRKKQQIVSLFFWKLPVKLRTVGDIQLNKETYDSEDDQGNSCKQHHSAMHEDIIYKL